jgi:hypothetical protein
MNQVPAVQTVDGYLQMIAANRDKQAKCRLIDEFISILDVLENYEKHKMETERKHQMLERIRKTQAESLGTMEKMLNQP